MATPTTPEHVEGISTSQATRWLRLSPMRVRQLADEGKIRYRICVLGRLLDPGDVERLRRERKATDA